MTHPASKTFSKPTFADPDLITGKAPLKTRLLWYAKNCDKLAGFMARLPKRLHYQGIYARPSPHNECGTIGCALGWAALSNIIPGLQYRELARGSDGEVFAYEPMVNGQGVKNFNMWSAVGYSFFGHAANNRVFLSTLISKEDLVEALREVADEYREEASELPDPLPDLPKLPRSTR